MAHNGWTNYETWTVVAWIENTLEPYKYWQDVTSRLVKSQKENGPRSQYMAQVFSERLENELGKSFLLKEVNWYEIAKSMIEDAEWEERNQD